MNASTIIGIAVKALDLLIGVKRFCRQWAMEKLFRKKQQIADAESPLDFTKLVNKK